MKILLLVFLFVFVCSASGCFAENDKETDGRLQNKGSFAEQVNGLGFRLLGDLNKEEQNIIISPVSLELTLGALSGAGSRAEQQAILRVLGGRLTGDTLNRENQRLLQENKNTGDIIKQTANSIWLDKELTPSEKYKVFLESFYGSDAMNVDFRKADEAAEIINKWCSDKTFGLISDAVKPQEISGNSLMLVNSLYLKAAWEVFFDEGNTFPQDFTPYSGSSFKVNMMHRTGRYRYINSKAYDAVSIPYKDGAFAMEIIVPADKKEMRSYLLGLRKKGMPLFADESVGKSGQCELALPRFQAESDISMLKQLRLYGMKTEGYTGLLSTGMKVKISDVLQSVVLKVNEYGTEAAAITRMPLAGMSLEMGHVIVDKPFVFNICDTVSGLIYFTGVIYQPEKAE